MAKARFPEAENRLFNRVFVCMDCGAKIKSDTIKVRSGKVKCRKCRGKNLRPVKKHK